jgi:hypothetical protein
VETGEHIHIWTDNLLGQPLVELLHVHALFHEDFNGMVSYLFVDGV